ncbi:hypothetical protein NPIL_332841 [Nephila pilipes]|uniref:Uncharacterized protein n=1 Tax=Nephila pilipes TaxID=299642 RepID=A0A8X6R4Z6_NEPPI|nr:hypothetical protein NPIL_332841 [Nephila pilipes]
MANHNLGFKFIRDVIRYVLIEYWPGIHWTPCGIFVHQNHDSPFTPSVQRIIQNTLDNNVVWIYKEYDNHFPTKNISAQQHYGFCLELTERMGEPQPENLTLYFLAICVTVSLITALSVLYDVREAPHISHILLFSYFAELVNLGAITDTFWEELQYMCELWLR